MQNQLTFLLKFYQTFKMQNRLNTIWYIIGILLLGLDFTRPHFHTYNHSTSLQFSTKANSQIYLNSNFLVE